MENFIISVLIEFSRQEFYRKECQFPLSTGLMEPIHELYWQNYVGFLRKAEYYGVKYFNHMA